MPQGGTLICLIGFSYRAVKDVYLELEGAPWLTRNISIGCAERVSAVRKNFSREATTKAFDQE